MVSAQPVNSFANEELYQTPPQYFGSIDNCNITDSSSISPHLNVWNPNPPIQPALSEDSLRITDTRYSKHNKTEDSGPASWGAICEDSVAPEDSISQGLYNDDTSLDHPYPRLVPKLSEVIPGSLPPTFGPKISSQNQMVSIPKPISGVLSKLTRLLNQDLLLSMTK